MKEIRLEKQALKKEKEKTDYDSKIEEWKESMRQYYEQRELELEQWKTAHSKIRNPLEFHTENFHMKFVDAGGIAEQYRTECLIVGKSYYRAIVYCYTEVKSKYDVDVKQLELDAVYRVHFKDLPNEVLTLPWLKPWEQKVNDSDANRKIYYVREMSRFYHTVNQEAQTQW